MEEAIRNRKTEEHWISGSVVKKALLPTFCFAVLSTIAFEEAVQAAQTNPIQTSIINEGTVKYVNISSGILNLRSGAEVSAPVIGSLTKGTSVTVFSETNGWAAVKVNGKNGYVSSLYLSTNNGGSPTTKYVNVSSGSLNLRQGASTSAQVITSISKGTAVSVYSETNGWAKVSINGKAGYVASQYLSTANPTAKPSTSTASNTSKPSGINSAVASLSANPVTKIVNVSSGSLNLRQGASTSAQVITSVSKGTAVSVYSETNGWAKVSVNGKAGYMASQYLSTANPTAKPSTNTASSTSKPSGTNPAVASLSANPVTKVVNVSSGYLNMRNGASTNASIIVKLAKGTSVKVYSDSGGWSKIVVYGQTGYVSSQYLSASISNTGSSAQVQHTQTVTKYVQIDSGSNLNLRNSASTSSGILATLSNGTIVQVYSESNGWSKIIVNGKSGYVSSEFLTGTKASNNNTAQQATNNTVQQAVTTKYVNVALGSSLNMRKSASINSSVLVKLARGVVVTVYSESGGWSKIKAYGQDGYVSSDYLSATKPAAGTDTTSVSNNTASQSNNTASDSPANEKFVNVIYGSSLNMRSDASTSAQVVTKLARGTVVTVISEANGWTKVSANGLTGYVSSQYLTITEPTNPNTIGSAPVTSYNPYNLSLNSMLQIQTAASPQTDKKYNTYIRADALTLNGTTSGIVNGSGWNVRGGAGTNYWVVGQVNSQDNLQILSKVKGSDGYDWFQVAYNKTWVNANPEDVTYYLDPNNFVNNTVDSMQFLKLSVSASLDATEVNNRILAGKGILQGMGSAFIRAGSTYGINEIYLISHALLETGNGSSQLAKGVEFNNKTVYNMYGIGALDNNPVATGAKFAYDAGWVTPEAAIIGGAQFIAKEYINAGQDTLYKMRWNPDSAAANGYASHQYATDIGWAEKQVNQIYNLYSLLNSYKLVFDIPQYK